MQIMHVHAVILLDIPHQTIIDRLSNRWVHAASGRTYAYDYNPPQRHGLDDVTGEPLTQRDDDKPETIRNRLIAFDKQTLPLFQFFEKQSQVSSRRFAGTESDVIYPHVKKFMQDEIFNA